MVDLEDPSRFESKFKRELAMLRESDRVAEKDREAIQAYVRFRDGDLAVGTLGVYTRQLRLAAARADVPLMEMDLEDWRQWRMDFRHDETVGQDGPPAPSTVHTYAKVARLFFEYHDRDWADEIDVSKLDPDPVDPRDMLESEDIAKLRDTANYLRDVALIEFLADTGARLTLATSLRVRDVDLDSETPTYTPNPNTTGLKGADIIPYPIIDSKGALRAYLRNTHPRPDEPDVALFHKLIQYEDDAGGLRPSALRKRLKKIGEEAGLDKPVNPHNFKHSAVTRMWREGYTKQQIQHRVHWRLDTDMWERYVHLKAEDMNETVFADAGMIDEEEVSTPRRDRCPNCTETLPEWGEFCPTCAAPVSKQARDLIEEGEDAGIESLSIEGLSAGQRKVLARALGVIRSDPAGATGHGISSSDGE